jgi:hypothetical protein
MKKLVLSFDELYMNTMHINEDVFDDAFDKFEAQPFGTDEDELKEYIELFKQYRQRKPKAMFDPSDKIGINVDPKQRDNIQAYKTVKDLIRIVDYIQQQQEPKEKQNLAKKNIASSDDENLIYENSI